ncbi:HXXEE domain-containing protein [Actinomyces lilanjuaniae]|uniref:HXXEE domain-containing protein n=1 Tax=Actinomyces lilanjuaniae TaxID=2321394 RepID=A0ABM6Z526_9ACTO|nr:HXXEE domain-containing protein [Actinomyces lilanjuaniae]AYD90196.1 HXXEE domain-containing protein [Actinomyces lilanjuaniae]
MATQFWYSWPWMGLGICLTVLVLMCGTNVLRSSTSISRWRDPAWFAWFPVVTYTAHQFEEYSFHITDGQYDLVRFVTTSGVLPFDLTNLPAAHFPVVNILLAWFVAPLAALLARRNPVVGFSLFGFMLFNGITHITGGLDPSQNPGVVTGTLLFIPGTVWMVVLCLREHVMSRAGLAVTLGAGILAHVIFFRVYALAPLGPVAVLAGDVVAVFLPLALAWLGCRLFRIAS